MKPSENKAQSPFKILLMILGILLLSGLVIDLFSGFSYIRSGNSFINTIGGLILIGFFVAIGESFFSWVGKIDKVEHSAGRRFINFIILLLTIIIVFVLLIFIGAAFD